MNIHRAIILHAIIALLIGGVGQSIWAIIFFKNDDLFFYHWAFGIFAIIYYALAILVCAFLDLKEK